eukprot:TRINITY_DN17870_c0_g1_i1.p1 TRINITY_DN17870_c0_g1~~TRINITY_DN17870_c0_g1_i1.p1  ORF type:complete len:402 (+),score=20.18 TRINITY_DN17870_c0_g1_i1:136-1341(+)
MKGAVEIVDEKIEAEVTCALCLKTFEDPLLLNCGHNFCLKCVLKSLIKANKEQFWDFFVTCPLCRKENRLRFHEPLQINLVLRNLIQVISSTTSKSAKKDIATWQEIKLYTKHQFASSNPLVSGSSYFFCSRTKTMSWISPPSVQEAYTNIFFRSSQLQKDLLESIWKTYGQIVVQAIPLSSFALLWSDRKSGAKRSLSIFRATRSNATNFYILGDIARPVHNAKEAKEWKEDHHPSYIIRQRKRCPLQLLADPTDYEKIWSSRGSKCQLASFWRPIPPKGYRALGDICVVGEEKPKPGDVPLKCVSELILINRIIGKQTLIWNDQKSGAKGSVSVWRNSTLDDEVLDQHSTKLDHFFSLPSHAPPDSERRIFCINRHLSSSPHLDSATEDDQEEKKACSV